MFNVLISCDETAWESEHRMRMRVERFGEYSGDEIEEVSLDEPESLKLLERVQSLLLYEDVVTSTHADRVRVGQVAGVRLQNGNISFRFVESGHLSRDIVRTLQHRLQLGDWELSRTHWAVKDGDLPQEIWAHLVATPKQYDVVLSFAGEDREYVEQVADFLNDRGVIAFYDKYEQATLWGKDLAEHFDSVYRQQARYCVMFISQHYAEKMWTRHERRAALAKAMAERTEYVLPARFDDTEIPGLRPTIGYVDLREHTPSQLGEMILHKLGRSKPETQTEGLS